VARGLLLIDTGYKVAYIDLRSVLCALVPYACEWDGEHSGCTVSNSDGMQKVDLHTPRTFCVMNSGVMAGMAGMAWRSELFKSDSQKRHGVNWLIAEAENWRICRRQNRNRL
jgi:hypothetical protein